jgi:Autographiviridae endonuclease
MARTGPKIKDPIDRFKAKYKNDDKTGCWNWTAGQKHHYGYGGFWFRGKIDFAHRASYAIHIGEIPEGSHVLHRCDNPKCVNPKHLFLGDQLSNMQDMRAKGRGSRHGQAGSQHYNHILSEADIPIIRARLETESAAAISRDYDVGDHAILSIKNGKSWSHVK